MATLSLTPTADADPLLVDAAIDRAPEAVGLALLRTRPLSRLERDTHEFLSVLQSGRPTERILAAYGDRLGLTDRDAYAGIVALVDLRPGVITTLETAMRRHARAAVSQMREGLLYAVVGMRATDRLVERRRRLLEDLRTVTYPDGALPAHVRVAVGPPVRGAVRRPRLAHRRDGLRRERRVGFGSPRGDGLRGASPYPASSTPCATTPSSSALVGDVLGELIAHDRAGAAPCSTPSPPICDTAPARRRRRRRYTCSDRASTSG